VGLFHRGLLSDTGVVDNAPTIDVLLVEDNDVFREALELMLGVMPDIRIVGSVGDGRSAVAVCEEIRPDVVLMDYRLPELDGVEATAAIRSASSDAAVVALTAAADSHEIDALYEAGAVACLTKDASVSEIVGVVRQAARRRALT
jgi:two-component system, NarL family, response regulator LiaR